MASYNGSHVPKLSHLWQLAVRAQSAIGEVAQAAADAVSAVADAKADKVEVVSLSIPASCWNTDSTAACPCYKDVAISGPTAADVVAVVVAPSSTAVAAAAGLATTESRAGVLRLRAQRAPTAAISASYYIIR